MLDGQSLVNALVATGFTHVIWIPDSELGKWDHALTSDSRMRLIRVCREGEAFGLAAGLWIGGKRPLIMIQCTGLFEAGDALRNVVHDLKIPIVAFIGVRSYHAHSAGKSQDTCPVYTEPILNAWKLPWHLLEDEASPESLEQLLRGTLVDQRPLAVLIPE